MFLFFKDKTKFERFLINKQLNYVCFSCFPGYHLKQEKQKNEFYDRNVDRDTHMDFNEYEDLPGLQNINLVKLGSTS